MRPAAREEIAVGVVGVVVEANGNHAFKSLRPAGGLTSPSRLPALEGRCEAVLRLRRGRLLRCWKK